MLVLAYAGMVPAEDSTMKYAAYGIGFAVVLAVCVPLACLLVIAAAIVVVRS